MVPSHGIPIVCVLVLDSSRGEAVLLGVLTQLTHTHMHAPRTHTHRNPVGIQVTTASL